MESDYENDNNWGNKKSEYYERNKRDKEDENYIQEEEEAIKIQQAKLKKWKEMNLLDSDNEEDNHPDQKVVDKYNLDSSDESENKENKITTSKSAKSAKSKSKKNILKKELVLTEEDQEEQTQILKNIKINLTEIEESIKPILEIFENEIQDLNLNLKSTTDYLKAKKNIHFLYTIYMLYYIYFKNQKKISDHHPVVKKMFFLKSTMNKIKSFNENIFNELDKVLKLIETKKILDEEEEENSEQVEESLTPEEDFEGPEKFLNKKRSNDIGVNELIESTKNKINTLRKEKDANSVKAKEKLTKEIENKNLMGQRLANENILKSRGLYRKRKRYQGNAKLHLREKYYKKEKQRKNMIKTYEGKPEVYGGESTGIRRDLIRSTKFK